MRRKEARRKEYKHPVYKEVLERGTKMEEDLKEIIR